MEENKKKNNSNIIWYGVLAVFFVFALWGVSWYYLKDCSERGTFGDMFGAVNALFSGLAFAGLIITLITQQKELKLQREELTLTRNEFKEQNKTLKQQRFENTFFNMLSLQQENVNNLVLDYSIGSGPKKQATSRMVFKSFYLEGVINTYNIGLKQLINTCEIETYTEVPDINMFDHYFRHLYRIIKFVDSSELLKEKDKDKEEKKRYEYTCIIRAQLSDYELVMMFYNGLAIKESKLKPLIERYALLNNLRFDLLADAKHKELYSEGAYNYKKKTTE